ncbi:MAG: heavy metal-binding domain-containing protein, partial [Candidatus Obscuribacterales bacterium]|nr:heavy metal-binding domain-containing protein [Candidatus Obscuribacterales bacterium]
MFWRKKSENEIRQKELQKASRREIENGGIPLIAQERLKKHAQSTSKFFTSDLSTREFLLSKDRDVQPIGQVMGTSFFNVNLFASMFRVRLGTGEMIAYSDAMIDARRLAVSRLLEEARLLNASGVIGVKIQAGRRPWSSSLHEFTAIGTAVRIPGWKHEPFACDLSGQEFWQLYSAGFRPVNLAFGICSYYMYV